MLFAPPPTAAERFGFIMAWLRRAVAARRVSPRELGPVIMLICNRLSRIATRFRDAGRAGSGRHACRAAAPWSAGGAGGSGGGAGADPAARGQCVAGAAGAGGAGVRQPVAAPAGRPGDGGAADRRAWDGAAAAAAVPDAGRGTDTRTDAATGDCATCGGCASVACGCACAVCCARRLPGRRGRSGRDYAAFSGLSPDRPIATISLRIRIKFASARPARTAAGSNSRSGS